ncbi:FAD-binding protein [Daeguia caeni]|uniref:FAD-binding protein n=1 Tax=Daeguia caeni TaxID=439612 RepID=A0ABV9H8I1_9HYPH
MTSSRHGQILISGAGVAGLSAALELSARGWKVLIVEKAAKLTEVGAGLQLAPNAMRHLQRLGVANHLAPNAVTPDTLYLVDGRSARPLLAMELGQKAEQRWQNPYWVCHRADLQAALLETCREHANITIALNATVSTRSVNGATIHCVIERDGKLQSLDVDYHLACDGVWSQARAEARLDGAEFSGHIAWRTTLATDSLPDSFASALAQKTAVSAWLGPNSHFIAYPVKAGKSFNFVAITKGENPGKLWSRSGDSTRLRKHFAQWSQPVRDILAATENWTYWPLFQMPKAQFVGADRTIFLGDASHAVTPFAAQGAAMAIEDAAALAAALDMPDRSAGLRKFDTVRKARLATVAKRGQMNRFAYHATGIFALGRNLLFAARSADAFLADLDWLYEYDAAGAIAA